MVAVDEIIKLVIPFPPGAATDIMARLLAEQIARAQGLTMLVENRPGANTMIGTEAVSRSLPDGNTLLVAGNAMLINPQIRKVNYDPFASFEPICRVAGIPQVITVNSASPYLTLGNLMTAARAKPGDLTLASIGPASATHIGFESLKRVANVSMTFVPFPGNAPASNALLGGHVTSAFTDYAGVAEQIKAGKLRALATASRERYELVPDLPTIAEAGYPDFEVEIWQGLFAPSRTPRETVSQIAGWFMAAMQAPEIKRKLVVQGIIPAAMCGADFATRIRKQYDDYGHIIREAKIRAE